MRSMQTQAWIALQEVMLAFFPTAVPLYVLGLFNAAYMADKCEFRPDKCTCMSERPVVGQALDILVYLHWGLSTAELGLYYLKIPYTRPRRLLRSLFYLSLAAFLWLDLTVVCLLSAWTFLGLNINPLKAGPYVIAAIGVVLYTAFTLVKRKVFQTRVEKALVKGVAQRRAVLAKVLLSFCVCARAAQRSPRHRCCLAAAVSLSCRLASSCSRRRSCSCPCPCPLRKGPVQALHTCGGKTGGLSADKKGRGGVRACARACLACMLGVRARGLAGLRAYLLPCGLGACVLRDCVGLAGVAGSGAGYDDEQEH